MRIRRRSWGIFGVALLITSGVDLLIGSDPAHAEGAAASVSPQGVVTGAAWAATVTVTGLPYTSVAYEPAGTVSIAGQTATYPLSKVWNPSVGSYDLYATLDQNSGARCGPNTVVVNNAAAAATGAASTTLTLLCPSITLSPATTYTPGAAVTVGVNYTDFDPFGDDNYKYLLVDSAPVARFGYRAPISFTTSAGCGTHTVQLLQPYAYGRSISIGRIDALPSPAPSASPSAFSGLSASATYTVQCAHASVTPGSLPRAGQAAGASFQAQQFPANSHLTITMDGMAIGDGTTDGSGNLTTHVTPRGTDCRAYTLIAATTSGPSVTAATTLQLTCGAVLGAAPTVVQQGMTTHITGSGFRPGASVTLNWLRPDGRTEPASGSPQTASASSDGSIDFYCLVMNLDELGSRTLTATDGTDSASTTVVVLRGTMQPGRSSGPMVARR